MLTEGLRCRNQAFLEIDDTTMMRRLTKMNEIRAEAMALFLALDLFFVKVCIRRLCLNYELTAPGL
jgi:hypothetical protein